MTHFEVDSETARGIHDFIGGRSNSLMALVAASREARARGPVEWRVAVTSSNVHSIEALHRFAQEERIDVQFEVESALDETERAFFDDYSIHRLTRNPLIRSKRKFKELVTASGEAADALLRACTPQRPTATMPDQLRTVVLIGAYGGDHVGDAAILGGVLHALHTRHGVTSATIMSHRADHTRRLADGLSTPVSISVEPYTAARVGQLLDRADALVLAGGPISDMPRVLAKHLAAAHAARIRGRPFLVERVGIGTFRHDLSAWAARQVLKLATSISVRFADSARHPAVDGMKVTIGRDPAFEYLATRGTLDRLSERDRLSVDKLFVGTEDSLLIGINLRPVLDKWHTRGTNYSRSLQDRFIEDFVHALEDFASLAPRPVKFVFFPMNAIQFGMSDLAAAYRLHRAVGRRIDLRVWETDPQVDGVLYFMRRLDFALAMRLHAAIFAISQNVPVIGVDYFSGLDGKLTQLFQDLGRSPDVQHMDTFDPHWLVGRLRDRLCLDSASTRVTTDTQVPQVQHVKVVPIKQGART